LSAIATALLAATLSSAVFAQELKPSDAPSAGGDIDKVGIAKKLANPIANMISVPLQYQFSRVVGANQGGSE